MEGFEVQNTMYTSVSNRESFSNSRGSFKRSPGFVSNEKTPIWNRAPKFFISVALACFSGLMLTLLLTNVFKLKPSERVAITIECCYQNVGIATSIALNMYEGDDVIEASGIPLMYGVCEVVLLSAFGVFAHYMNWTYANKREVSFIKAVFSVNQDDKDRRLKLPTDEEGEDNLKS